MLSVRDTSVPAVLAVVLGVPVGIADEGRGPPAHYHILRAGRHVTATRGLRHGSNRWPEPHSMPGSFGREDSEAGAVCCDHW